MKHACAASYLSGIDNDLIDTTPVCNGEETNLQNSEMYFAML
jgi:hypothetical protein